MKRSWLNYIIDIIIGLAFIGLAVTGLLKYQGVIRFFSQREIQLPSNEITIVHRWAGLSLTIGALLHLLLHLKWIGKMTGNLFKNGKRRRAKQRVNRLPRSGLRSRPRRDRLKRIKKLLPGIIGVCFVLMLLVFFRAVSVNGEPPGPAESVAVAGGRKAAGEIPDSPSVPSVYESPEELTIRGQGRFSFNPNEIEAIRSDIFSPGSFSVFDILVHLDNRGEIDMEYIWNGELSTHIIESLNGEENWWYRVIYDGGWNENNVFRMDLYPYKDRTSVILFQERPDDLDAIYDSFRKETARKQKSWESLVIPEVIIDGTGETIRFEAVVVTPHNLRSDLFREGTVTAIDVIMSLGEQGKLTYDLQWYESIGSAGVVRNYFVQGINGDFAWGRCGFVYDSGSLAFFGFSGNHIHLPADARVLTSPEYLRFFWICI